MCVNCHARIATRMRLQPLGAGAKAWTAEQSRQNFEAVSRVVVAGDVMKSPLAVHPLAQAAGGDAQHTGGKFWTTQENPEWQTVATWIRAASPAGRTPAVASSALDFEYFRTRVQPIFLAKRPGHARCITCHENGSHGSSPCQRASRPGTTSSRARTSRPGSGWSSLATRPPAGC